MTPKDTAAKIEQYNREIQRALKHWPILLKSYAQADTRKAILQMITSFLPFLALWVLMYFSLSWSYWITLGLAAINAFFLVRIFIIQHDCGHRSYFKSQTWNNIVGVACSFFSTIPYAYWAKEHSFHHGHSGQLETRTIGDIMLMTENEYRQASRLKRLGYRIYRMPLMTFVLGPILYMLYNNRFPIVKLPGWGPIHRRMFFENLLIAGVYVVLAWVLGWQRFLLVHCTVVALFAIVAIWFFYVQHQHEASYKQWQENWDYLLSAIRGSTFYKLPRFMHWLTGNIGYHHIHHLNSKIPSYHLARCARENPLLQRYVTAITFRESLQFMFHKLWSEEEERMITFREYRRRERARRRAVVMQPEEKAVA